MSHPGGTLYFSVWGSISAIVSELETLNTVTYVGLSLSQDVVERHNICDNVVNIIFIV